MGFIWTPWVGLGAAPEVDVLLAYWEVVGHAETKKKKEKKKEGCFISMS